MATTREQIQDVVYTLCTRAIKDGLPAEECSIALGAVIGSLITGVPVGEIAQDQPVKKRASGSIFEGVFVDPEQAREIKKRREALSR